MKEKNTEISARIAEIIEEIGENPSSFAKHLGYQRAQTIYDILSGKSAPSYDFFNKLANTEISARINLQWLLTGRGEMLKDAHSSTPEKKESEDYNDKDKKNNTLDQNITDKSSPICATSQLPSVGTPYYDVDFIGGFDEVFNSQVSVPTTNIVIRGFEKANLWCNVTGHSMEPKINHGDIIALRRCTLNDIQYGEIYAVVLDTIRTIKILRRSSDPTKLRFIPINTESYDEQEFEISRITGIFEVIGSISKFF